MLQGNTRRNSDGGGGVLVQPVGVEAVRDGAGDGRAAAARRIPVRARLRRLCAPHRLLTRVHTRTVARLRSETPRFVEGAISSSFDFVSLRKEHNRKTENY